MPSTDHLYNTFSPHLLCQAEKTTRIPRRTSLTQIVDNRSLIHQPTKLKLYAALTDQNSKAVLKSHFTQYKAMRLDREHEDKTLLCTLFNWTEDAAQGQDLNIEIIVGDKFSMTNSACNTPRAGGQLISFTTCNTPRSQPITFEEILKTRYESYKQNYNNKASARPDSNGVQPASPQKNKAFASRDTKPSYESSDAETKCEESQKNNSRDNNNSKQDVVKLKPVISIPDKWSSHGYNSHNARAREVIGIVQNQNNPQICNMHDAKIVRLKHSLNMYVR